MIQQCPDINWDITYELIKSRKDPRYGPDDICYAFCKYVPDPVRRALYDFYNSLKGGIRSHGDFNDVRLVSLSKDREDGDYDNQFTCSSDQTRPISLSNTDNKLN